MNCEAAHRNILMCCVIMRKKYCNAFHLPEVCSKIYTLYIVSVHVGHDSVHVGHNGFIRGFISPLSCKIIAGWILLGKNMGVRRASDGTGEQQAFCQST